MTIEGIYAVSVSINRDVQKSILVVHPLIPPVFVFKLVDIAFLNSMYRSALEVLEQAHRSIQ